MRPGTKKIFPKDYSELVDSMIYAAEQEMLPLTIAMDDPQNITFVDVQDLMIDFKKDTSLDIRALIYMCEDCGHIHLNMEIDYSDTEPTLIQ